MENSLTYRDATDGWNNGPTTLFYVVFAAGRVAKSAVLKLTAKSAVLKLRGKVGRVRATGEDTSQDLLTMIESHQVLVDGNHNRWANFENEFYDVASVVTGNIVKFSFQTPSNCCYRPGPPAECQSSFGLRSFRRAGRWRFCWETAGAMVGPWLNGAVWRS
jgi:hypothetical protein